MADGSDADIIKEESALRALYGAPGRLALAKQQDRLDRHCRRFIELSPFLCLATSGADGRADNSPRGDAPGFVGVADEKTLLLPDRPGNNRIDSLSNIVHRPEVGLLFFIPGFTETLRINGRAKLSTAPELLVRFAVGGRPPKLVVVVTVDEVFLQCSKALIRSRLWEEDAKVERKALPTLGRMIADVADAKTSQTKIKSYDDLIERNIEEELY
ncbi:MAG: pyridoxamine 5'-phosphate oxidase family protein [Alphaproteobacteria bacterium]|nr:pyridoxamine 5'-phosphate oxidase family protein [Alphaproteobacteria bacterium]